VFWKFLRDFISSLLLMHLKSKRCNPLFVLTYIFSSILQETFNDLNQLTTCFYNKPRPHMTQSMQEFIFSIFRYHNHSKSNTLSGANFLQNYQITFPMKRNWRSLFVDVFCSKSKSILIAILNTQKNILYNSIHFKQIAYYKML
jgi:hypothetical protein